MLRPNLFLVIAVLVSVVQFCPCGEAYSESATEREKSSAKKPMPWDLGPGDVDVSGYPPEMQSNYEVFAEKCSGCHTLARPLNAPYATPEEWNTYVNKMMRKPGSGIDKAKAKQIFKFLVYDSKKRKLADPDAWERHIEKLISEFQKKYGKK
ncbi:MAG: hypothetical protein V3W00_06475 [Candidatus Brocadiales bacterium]